MLLKFQLKLTDGLLSGVEFSKAKDAELGWVDGIIHMNKDENTGEVFPVLDTLPQTQVYPNGRTLEWYGCGYEVYYTVSGLKGPSQCVH